MCIINKNSRTACCYYDSDLKCLFYLKDYQESETFDSTQLILHDLHPSVLITSDKCEPRFLRFLKACVERPIIHEENESTFSRQFQQAQIFKTLQIVSSIDFEYEVAKNRIFNLNSLAGKINNFFFCCSKINLKNLYF